MNEEKRLELIPENVSILQDAFNYYESTVSQRNTIRYIRETYGVNWCDATFRRMLKDKLAIGVYDRGGRYNENFCPAAIKKEQFDRVQNLLKKNARSAPSGNIYIFTSILKCAECDHNLIGRMAKRNYDIAYYRCNQHYKHGRCTHNKEIREDVIEKWLFDHLEKELNRYQLEWEVNAAVAKKRSAISTDKATFKRKLSKLKELYVNELIDIEEYKKDYEIYTAALRQLPELQQEAPPDFSAVKRLLAKDFKTIYDTLTREEKRTLCKRFIVRTSPTIYRCEIIITV